MPPSPEYRKALAINPDDADARKNLDDALNHKAHSASTPGLDEAVVHFHRGVALKDSGDLDGAIAEYRKALAINPDLADAHNNLGVALEAKGDKGSLTPPSPSTTRRWPSSPTMQTPMTTSAAL